MHLRIYALVMFDSFFLHNFDKVFSYSGVKEKQDSIIVHSLFGYSLTEKGVKNRVESSNVMET